MVQFLEKGAFDVLVLDFRGETVKQFSDIMNDLVVSLRSWFSFSAFFLISILITCVIDLEGVAAFWLITDLIFEGLLVQLGLWMLNLGMGGFLKLLGLRSEFMCLRWRGECLFDIVLCLDVGWVLYLRSRFVFLLLKGLGYWGTVVQ